MGNASAHSASVAMSQQKARCLLFQAALVPRLVALCSGGSAARAAAKFGGSVWAEPSSPKHWPDAQTWRTMPSSPLTAHTGPIVAALGHAPAHRCQVVLS